MTNPLQKSEFQSWSEDLANDMVTRTMKYIDSTVEKKGGDTEAAAQFLCLMFIARFIGVMLFRCLSRDGKPQLTRDEEYKQTTKSMGMLKAHIQEAVSLGFSGAMTTFTGKQIDYYCQIRPVPEAMGKKDV